MAETNPGAGAAEHHAQEMAHVLRQLGRSVKRLRRLRALLDSAPPPPGPGAAVLPHVPRG